MLKQLISHYDKIAQMNWETISECCPFHSQLFLLKRNIEIKCPKEDFNYQLNLVSLKPEIYRYNDDKFLLVYVDGENTLTICVDILYTISDSKSCLSKQDFISYCKSGVYKNLLAFI